MTSVEVHVMPLKDHPSSLRLDGWMILLECRIGAAFIFRNEEGRFKR